MIPTQSSVKEQNLLRSVCTTNATAEAARGWDHWHDRRTGWVHRYLRESPSSLSVMVQTLCIICWWQLLGALVPIFVALPGYWLITSTKLSELQNYHICQGVNYGWSANHCKALSVSQGYHEKATFNIARGTECAQGATYAAAATATAPPRTVWTSLLMVVQVVCGSFILYSNNLRGLLLWCPVRARVSAHSINAHFICSIITGGKAFVVCAVINNNVIVTLP